VNTVDMGMAPILHEWTHPKVDQLRHTCPIPKEAEDCRLFDLTEFEKFLTTNTNQRSELTKGKTMMGLKRFLYLLQIPGRVKVTPVGLMCSLYQSGLLTKMREKPLMDPKYAWSRNMLDALSVYCQRLIPVCGRKRWPEAKQTLEQLAKDDLIFARKQCFLSKKQSAGEKKAKDAIQLSQFPDAALIKEQVRIAMATLYLIDKHCRDNNLKRLTLRLSIEALTACVGIIHYNSFAGRCGEWEIMKREHVQDQLSKGSTFLLCDVHKTAGTYGAVAKYVPPGSWKHANSTSTCLGRRATCSSSRRRNGATKRMCRTS